MGVNKGVNIPPRGQISPLGVRGEVKNGPLATGRIECKQGLIGRVTRLYDSMKFVIFFAVPKLSI
jgi:hypothetical protein